MDKDLIILKGESLKTDEAKRKADDLVKSNDSQLDKLADIQKRLDALYKKTGKAKLIEVPQRTETIDDEESLIDEAKSYSDLYEESRLQLIENGLDVESIDFESLLSESELAEIINELDAPLPKEDKWKKADYIVVFIAAFVGGVTDFVLGDRENKLTGKGSKFSDSLNEIHETKWKHASDAPIDFQGKNALTESEELAGVSFGGGNHRSLSKGHDLLRFVEGIKQFKDGKFEAVAFKDGAKLLVTSSVNQYGKPYEQMALIEAIGNYIHHMAADIFSTNSLPFPGYSFLQESDSRRMRKFSADMYANGFNLKNAIIQSASTIAIEVIIRMHFSIQSVKKYDSEVEIAEDYSNWEAIKRFFRPLNKDKLHEMLLVAHSIVLALNVGKIVIKSNTNPMALASLNITEITSVVNYGIKVVKAVAKRNNEYAKLIYHSSEIQENWQKLGNEFGIADEILIAEMKEELIIA